MAESFIDGVSLGLPRIGRGCVDGAALDEESHEEDQSYPNKDNGPPVLLKIIY